MEKNLHCKNRYLDFLFGLQTLGILLLVFSSVFPMTLIRAVYCMVVCLIPWLLFEFGLKYINSEKFSAFLLVALVIELLLCILFVGSMVLGIRDSIQPIADLFAWFLVAFTIDSVICVANYLFFATNVLSLN